MKTILLINSSGTQYFRRLKGRWQFIEHPDRHERIWVIANLPEEMLEAIQLPPLFGSDRGNYLARHLAAAYPHSQYRAASVIAARPFKHNTALISGLGTETSVRILTEITDSPIAGVWGISLLLTLLTRRLSITDVILGLPSRHYLRIVVFKKGLPVLTRCVHRDIEHSDHESDADANEILRTRQHLENRRIFEPIAIPPVLYLGDSRFIASTLNEGGLTLLPLPEKLSPKGDAAYFHFLFEFVISSPTGQLAPPHLRAKHITQRLQQATYTGMAITLLAVILLGQQDFRTLINLNDYANKLNDRLQQVSDDQERLAAHIRTTGLDPVLLRQATQFSVQEIAAAPSPSSLLQLTAYSIADLSQLRIKSLHFAYPEHGERYCRESHLIESTHTDQPFTSRLNTATSIPPRHTELQFTVLATETLAPEARSELYRRISAKLKNRADLKLIQDPATFSLLNTIKGGFDTNDNTTDHLWCMSIPWNSERPGKSP